jgi:hypothetical protein
LSYGDKILVFCDIIEEISEAGNKKIRKDYHEVSVAQFIIDELSGQNLLFEDPNFQIIFNTFEEYLKKGQLPHQDIFLKNENPKISQATIDTIFSKYSLSEKCKKHGIHTFTEDMQLKQAAESVVYAFKIIKIEITIEEKRKLLENLELDEQLNMMKSINQHLQIKKEISKKLGRIILK